MEIFYEESAIAKNAKDEESKYKRFQLASNILFAMGFVATVIGCGMFLTTQFIIWLLTFCIWFFVGWFIFYKLKQRHDVSYDYVFISGEIRISKVIHTSKRKLLATLQPDDILQLGDVDNPSFQNFRLDPNVKTLYCTPNSQPMEGKFFLYILASYNGKKLFVLECREELLANMLRFVKRTILESDYVAQDKKKKV